MADPRPNIVFVIPDQLSAKWLEQPCRSACRTPGLDRLQRDGVTFSRFISSNPVCCPTRATMATGLTTRGHGLLQNGYRLDESVPTFMRQLRDAGWRTGAFGKIHLHPHYESLHPDYSVYGWDVVRNTEDPRAGYWRDWVEREHPRHFEQALATVWATGIPELRSYGPEGRDLSERIRAIRASFPWATEEHPGGTHAMYTLPFPEEVSQTRWTADNAIRFIAETPADQPLYAHISFVQPHLPSCPPARTMGLVNPDRLPSPIPPHWPDDPTAPACLARTEGATAQIPEDWRLRRWYYMADVAHIDEQLGRIVRALEESGRWPNTYLIFMSDHGEMLLDHGFVGKAERHYDGCIRVPLTVAGPGLEPGTEHLELIQPEDLFPTVLEMAGLPLPRPAVGAEVQSMQDLSSSHGIYGRGAEVAELRDFPGSSLIPLCRGESPPGWREWAYTESYNNIDSFSPTHWARTVRDAHWRYTYYPAGGGEQLFDLENDPDEAINLAADPGHAATRNRLRDMLLESVVMQDHPHTPRSRFALGVH